MGNDSKNSDSNLVLEKISWKITAFCGLINKRREVQVGGMNIYLSICVCLYVCVNIYVHVSYMCMQKENINFRLFIFRLYLSEHIFLLSFFPSELKLKKTKAQMIRQYYPNG